MAKDWSRSALDDLFLSGAVVRPVQSIPVEHAARKRRDLGLPAMCLLVGAMVALLYVWPVLILTQLLAGGMRSEVFWPVFAGSVPAAAVVAWAMTSFERRYWAGNWQNVSDWADPSPWK